MGVTRDEILAAFGVTQEQVDELDATAFGQADLAAKDVRERQIEALRQRVRERRDEYVGTGLGYIPEIDPGLWPDGVLADLNRGDLIELVNGADRQRYRIDSVAPGDDGSVQIQMDPA